jgi:hypothetical protein
MPPGITSITLSGTYLRGNLAPATGYVTFVPSVAVSDPSGPAILATSTVTVPLDATGSFTTTLAATDDVATSPSGWLYTVVEQIDGTVRSYQITLPHAAPTVNIASLSPAATVPLSFSYATTAQLLAKIDRTGDTMTGPLTLAGAPTTSLQAATKAYVDALGVGPFLPLAGGSLTGPLVISGSNATIPTLFGSSASGGSLQLTSTSNATKGFIYLGTGAAWDGANSRLGVGTQAPGFLLDVQSAASAQTGQVKRTAAGQSSAVLALLDGDTTSAQSLSVGVVGDTVTRFASSAGGILSWGAGGGAARDTNLYRSAAATLKTDSSLVVGGRITGPQVLTAFSNTTTGIAASDTDITSATLTFTTTKTNTLVLVVGSFDFSIATGATGLIQGKLVVDGTNQTTVAAAVFPTTSGRASVCQTWVITLATAASHTLKLRAINGTGQTVNSNSNSSISVAVFDF